MKCTNYLALLATAVGIAQAHTRVFGVWVNGVDQGDGRNTYIRTPRNNSPVKDVESTDINCNVDNRAVPSFVSAKAGDKLDIEWFHDNRNDDIIDGTHKGPITVHIADIATNGNGAAWTKIAEEGFANGKWAIENLKTNNGKHALTLPASLAPGDYLLRADIIAHHESDTDFKVNANRGAQFYPNCIQLRVTSGGSAKPNQNFNFVGGYKSNSPGILFNLYSENPNTYVIPGTPVWAGSGTGNGGSNPAPPAPVPTSTRLTTTIAPPVQPPVQTARPTATGCAPAVTVTVTVTANGGSAPAAPTGGASALAAKYAQCGGQGFRGATACAAGTSCKVLNPYYSQCL